METLQGRNTSDNHASSGDGPPADRPQGGKLSRIAGHTQGLVEDLREWIDLRIDLAILEVEEEVDKLRNDVALGLLLAFFGFLTALFLFTTLALGIGWALGRPFWGFLIVTVSLGVFVVALRSARPNLLPPSNLFDKIRGNPDEEDADSPVRDAQATVEEEASPAEDRA